MENGKFPIVVDNTMRSLYKACPRKFWQKQILGLQPKGTQISIDLIAGAAFAKALEVTRKSFYLHGLSPKEATIEGIKALFLSYGDTEVPEDRRHKGPERVLAAFESYLDRFPLGQDSLGMAMIGGKPAVEFSATLELPLKNPDTGDPLLLSTRYDWIGVYGNSMLLGVDEETCSQMGAKWANQWNTRAQFMGYAYVAHRHGIPVAGTQIRGVQLLLTKIHHAEAIVYAKPYLLERWYKQFLKDIQDMIRSYEQNEWGYNFSDSCTAFWGCSYAKLCLAEHPQVWIDAEFEAVKPWNPTEVD